ncbi:uncharacterized protein LOC112032860 [Quercus suber]|uniref:uncharacterized protein LOC112032860 n=1 Tax=Quercus suber TaxID=58331 RepID=UPI000D2BEFFA|nr:hypothetical protein CFP56_60810 [Quercus suber]
MAARAGPPPPDFLYSIPRIPDLDGLAAFQKAIPQSLPNLPAPIQNVEIHDGYRFLDFLDAIEEHNIEMWEKDPNGRVLNVSAVGRKVFLSIGKIVAGIHKRRQFAGNLIDRIRIYEDQSVNFPFPNMSPNAETTLNQGILTDLIHFRWMVARVIVTSLPNYHQMLSETFKLFFSEIYIHHSDKYSIFQLLHPIFFDASDRMSFLQLIQDYLEENPKAKNGLRHLDHFFEQWWNKWNNFPMLFRDVFDRVYNFRKNNLIVYGGQSSTLPRFIRNMHHHYAKHGQRQMHPTHEEIDSWLHEAFPGVCEVIVDGQIRSFHSDWLYIPRNTNPWDKFYHSLAQYFITKPYPFTVEPYSYQY